MSNVLEKIKNLKDKLFSKADNSDKNMQEKNICSKIWDAVIKWTDDHYVIVGFIASVLSASAFVGIMIYYEKCMVHYCCCCNEPQFVTSDERIVLAFVGILATFVVLTNHAQSTERIKQLERLLAETKTELDSTIEQQKVESDKELKRQMQVLANQHMSHALDFVDACQDRKTYNLCKTIVDNINNNKNASYQIGIGRGRETIAAKISVIRETVCFYAETEPFELIPANRINTVNGVKYNAVNLNKITLTLLQLTGRDKQQRVER